MHALYRELSLVAVKLLIANLTRAVFVRIVRISLSLFKFQTSLISKRQPFIYEFRLFSQQFDCCAFPDFVISKSGRHNLALFNSSDVKQIDMMIQRVLWYIS